MPVNKTNDKHIKRAGNCVSRLHQKHQRRDDLNVNVPTSNGSSDRPPGIAAITNECDRGRRGLKGTSLSPADGILIHAAVSVQCPAGTSSNQNVPSGSTPHVRTRSRGFLFNALFNASSPAGTHRTILKLPFDTSKPSGTTTLPTTGRPTSPILTEAVSPGMRSNNSPWGGTWGVLLSLHYVVFCCKGLKYKDLQQSAFFRFQPQNIPFRRVPLPRAGSH